MISTYSIVDAYLPDTGGILAPGVHAHEGPVLEAVLGEVAGSLGQQHGVGAHGRGQVQVEIASSRVLYGHEQLHVLQVLDVILGLAGTAGRFDLDLERLARAQTDRLEVDRRDLADALGRHGGPVDGRSDEGGSVQETETEAAVDLEAGAVGLPARVLR